MGLGWVLQLCVRVSNILNVASDSLWNSCVPQLRSSAESSRRAADILGPSFVLHSINPEVLMPLDVEYEFLF
jgi:hypothetical protein